MPEWMYLRWLVWNYKRRTGQADLHVLERYLKPADTAVDVGANRGVWIQLMAPQCQHVYAYEPDAQMMAFARRHLPPNATLHHCALSDTDGEAVLTTPIWGGQASRTHGSLQKDFSGHQTITQTVPKRRLDTEGLRGVGFVKIDVEGHELSVLKGADGLLRSDKPVVWVEVEPRHGARPHEVADHMATLGYQGYFFWHGERLPVKRFDVALHAPTDGGARVENFLYLPPGHPDTSG